MSAPFSVQLRRGEILGGGLWLLVYTFLLGDLVRWGLPLFGLEPEAAGLNGAYFLLGFCVTGAVLWRLLRDSLMLAAREPGALLKGIVLGFCLYEIIQIGLGILYENLLPELLVPNDAAVTELIRSRPGLMGAGMILLTPLTEEALTRGVVFGALRQRSRVLGYVISALFFGLMHIAEFIGTATPGTLLACLPLYALPGVALCACYEKAGTVWGPILLHAAINAIGFGATLQGL